MDGVKICKQAQNLANELNFTSGLQFTEGWLRGFKKRYDLHRRVAHGEKQSADEISAERWVKEVWPLLVAKYGLENIFNCNETCRLTEIFFFEKTFLIHGKRGLAVG